MSSNATTETTLIQQIEQLKQNGNDAYSTKCYHDAITLYYNKAIVMIDALQQSQQESNDFIVLKCTVLSNRALTYIKLYEEDISSNTTTPDSLQHAIDDCQLAITLLNDNNSSISTTATATATTLSTKQLRSKLLYRSAKARFLLANHHSTTTTSTIKTSLLNDAAKDLLQLLDIDHLHKEGTILMKMIRTQHHTLNVATSTSSTGSTNTPLGKVLTAMASILYPSTSSSSAAAVVTETTSPTSFNQHQVEQLELSCKQLYSIIHDNVPTSCNEMIRFHYTKFSHESSTSITSQQNMDGLTILLECVDVLLQQQPQSTNGTTTTHSNRYKSVVLVLQCIATISNQVPTFVRSHISLPSYQYHLVSILQRIYEDNSTVVNTTTTTTITCVSDCIVVLLSIWHSILLHSDRDDLQSNDIQNTTKIDYKSVIETIHLALAIGQQLYTVSNNTTNAIKSTTFSATTVYRAVMDIISVFIAGGTDRDHRIRVSLLQHHSTDGTGSSTKSLHKIDPLLPNPLSAQEIRNFTPQQLATYKKRQYDIKLRNDTWSYERARILFGEKYSEQKHNNSNDAEPVAETHEVNTNINIVEQLFHIAIHDCTDDIVVRREITICISRIMTCIEVEDTIKELIRPYLFSTTSTIQNDGKDEPYIEEIYNEDEEAKHEVSLDHKDLDKVFENDGITITKSFQQKIVRAILATAVLLLPSKKECTSWILSSDGWNTASDDIQIMIESHHTIALCYVVEVIQAAAVLESTRPIVMNLISGGSMEVLMKSQHRDIRSGAAATIAKLGLANTKKGTSDDNEGELMGLLQAACELFEDRDDVNNETKDDTTKSKNNNSNQYSSYATSSVERAVEMITYLVAHTTIKEEIAAGFGGTSGKPVIDLLVQAADQPGAGESMSGYSLANIFQLMAVTNEQIRREAFEGKEVTMEQYDEMQRMGKTEEEKEIMDQEKDMDTKDLCHERIRKMAHANVPRALVALTENASEQTLDQLTMSMNRMAEEITVRGIMIQQGVLSTCIKIEKAEGPTETDVMKKVIRTARHCIAKMLISTNPSLLTSAQKLGAVKPLISLIRDIKGSDLQHFEALLAITNIGSAGEDSKNRIVSEKGIATFHFAMFSDHELVRRAATEALCNLVPHEKMMEHLQEVDHLRLWLAFAVDYEEPHYECARAAAGCLAMATQDESIAQTLVGLDKFKIQMTSILESGRLEIMHRAFVIVYNLVLHGSNIRKAVIDAGLIEFCRAYIELQNHSVNVEEFTMEEQQLVPVTVNIAKQIVQSAD